MAGDDKVREDSSVYLDGLTVCSIFPDHQLSWSCYSLYPPMLIREDKFRGSILNMYAHECME